MNGSGSTYIEKRRFSGRALINGRPKGGKNTAKLSDDEWRLVVAERKRLVKENPHGGDKHAATLILRQLVEGTFPGIARKIDNLPSASWIARKTVTAADANA
ncbi:hypothetical protein Mal64_37840 [Pseudobythopirellula maris]|uniref:Uncharacterized protein n=1 Tax=Pseudobythopirellula maris TaxID=2527991 RepID=A0A5C5ZGL2_9BACT|nr:hypothetical protein [Pseudobythopirellula maris]TWT86245.1 hypothetical protein Mal64_37840 [Pseudobythopirellula maris]